MTDVNLLLLSSEERIFYRDRLRAARYSALADAEGFQQTCYALEALGRRLLGQEAALDKYKDPIREIAMTAPSLSSLPVSHPMFFTRFDALYETVRRARNDVMHGGVHARHATGAAIELCIGLEEAVMSNGQRTRIVRDYMVKTPVIAEAWHPIALLRQTMLTHSFSFLPFKHDEQWKLVSEMSLVMYLHGKTSAQRKAALAKPLSRAVSEGLPLASAEVTGLDTNITSLLASSNVSSNPVLWLVVDPTNTQTELVGILSPFELM